MNLYVTDPEFMERFEHFAFDEVPNEEGQQLDDETRYMVILATLIGCQGMEEYRLVLSRALDGGFAPIADASSSLASSTTPALFCAN